MSAISTQIRNDFKTNDDIRDAGLTTPDDIKRYDDICYGPYKEWNVLDVYRPKDATGKLPVIVSIHGGGWVYGDKERYQYYCMSLAQHGFAVVNYTYRLAPEFKFPAQLEDTNIVFNWIFENADEYGFDTNNIFAVGDSAGAHLLSIYSCICTNDDYAKKFSFCPPQSFIPKAVALNCGIYKMNRSMGIDMMLQLMEEFLTDKGTEKEYNLISPIDFVTEKFPPAFIMTAEGDFLLEQAKPLADKLSDCGVDAEYHFYGDKEHVLGHVFHCNMRLTEAAVCNQEECEFFKKHIS